MTAAAFLPRARAPQHRARTGLQAFLLALVLALAAGATPADASWGTMGTGFGTAYVDTLGTGAQPVTSVAGTTITVQWTQTAFRGSPLGGYAGGGYTILRHPAAGGLAVTPNAGCGATVSGTAATLTCTETGVPTGDWQYSVTPVLNSWTGVQGIKSTTQTVASATPTLSSATAQDPATGSTTGSVALTWTAVSGATGYDVFRRTSAGSYDFTAPLNGITPLTGTTYTDPGSGLTGGTTYAYVVRARTSTSTSASSNERSATVVARPPAPATTTATPAAAANVTVSWAAVSGATGYVVFRRTSTGAYDYASPLTTTTSQTTFTDTTAVDGTAYRYVVRATAPGAGATPLQSVDGPEASATADGVAPTAVSLADPGVVLSGVKSFTVNATGATSARVQAAPTGTTTFADICVAPAAPFTCTYNTAGLADGTYDLRAIASDDAGNTTTSALLTRKVDNTAPSATLADPGDYIRATVTLSATASDGGSGLTNLTISRAPTGTATFTQICAQTTSPANCSLNTTTLTEGAGYDFRAVATDAAGNTTTVLVSNRIVDNTAPTGITVQADNGTGTKGKADAGDKITYTYSEPIAPGSISAGWDGTTPLAVTGRFLNSSPDTYTTFNGGNTAALPLGVFNAGSNKIFPSNVFSGSTMVVSGNSFIVTLGTQSVNSITTTSATTLYWTTNVAATDRAGNPVVAATLAETGAFDVDF